MKTIKVTITVGLLFLLLPLAHSQKNENRDTASVSVPDTMTEEHSPSKAALRSAIIPGWGQVYNRKFWKIPVIYGGLGASTYFIVRNTQRYKQFKSAYIARVDDDPNTTDEFENIYTEEQLRTIQDTYRRWRDLSYISLTAFYILNILDASVDAHLYDFDVSDDLSLRIEPYRTSSAFKSHTGFRVLMKF